MNAIERLIRPRHVAVIGASADPSKLTGRPIGYLLKHGFSGQIFPVNPRITEVAGLTCYPDVASLPIAPDVGLVLVGPEQAQKVVGELAERGASAAIVLASGYGEAGEEGARRQQALKEAAGAMRLLGPNTIGLVNLTDRITLSVSGALEVGDLPAGRISVVSQSGGILGSLLSRAADRGIGFAKLVSTGNEADLDTSDFLETLVEDENTAVLAVYMEGLRRPAAFRRGAQRAAELGKPIVVFKVGRSESGARGAVSHTGALAGADRMYDALFKQCGVIRVNDFADLLDIPAALASNRRPRGKRIAILTSTGGAGTLVADSCGMAGLDVPVPDRKTAERLAALHDGDMASASRNPVDMTLAGLRPDLFRATMTTLLESPSYDALVVIVGSSALAQPTLVTDAAVACQALSDKPLLAYVSPHAPHIVRLLNQQGVPSFSAPESCAAALAAMTYAAPERITPPAPIIPVEEIALTPGPLNEAESKALFARFGVQSVREIVVADGEAAEAAARSIGGRIVLKILSRTIAHKSDIGGVCVGVAASDVRCVCNEMRDTLRAKCIEPEGFLVQELVVGGIEMILGLYRDPQLGLAVLLGMGGIAAELFDDTVIRLLPLARRDAEAMVYELKTARLLTGYRGKPKRDIAALIDAILAFACMGEQLGERLIEAEINPLFILLEGEGVRAADGVAILG